MGVCGTTENKDGCLSIPSRALDHELFELVCKMYFCSMLSWLSDNNIKVDYFCSIQSKRLLV